MNFGKSFNYLFAIFLLSCAATETFASAWPSTEAEFARLPPYCKARHGPKYGLYVPEAEIRKWKRLLGSGFLHVHHFCAGLNSLIVLNKRAGEPKEYELDSVLKEFDYTQRHSKSTMALQPLISVEKGKLLLRLNRTKLATQEFYRAIKLRPTYTASYAALSDYYVKSGQTDEAKKILNKGLKHSPKSKKLRRRLAKLK